MKSYDDTFSISSMNLSLVRTSTVAEKLRSFSLRPSSLSFDGISVTVIFSSNVRRKLICVAKRVQRVLATGNWIPVSASRSEDFPLDWSPTTTSYFIISKHYVYSNEKQTLSEETYLRERYVFADPKLSKLVNNFEKLY